MTDQPKCIQDGEIRELREVNRAKEVENLELQEQWNYQNFKYQLLVDMVRGNCFSVLLTVAINSSLGT